MRQIHLLLRDPAYTDRLAAFLQSVGQETLVSGPDSLDLTHTPRDELEIYLRVWQVLYPEAEVEIALGA